MTASAPLRPTDRIFAIVDRLIEDDEPISNDMLSRLLAVARRGEAIATAFRLRAIPHEVSEAVVRPGQDRTKAVDDFVAMGRALLAYAGPFIPGTCRVCGCGESTACSYSIFGSPYTCSWIDGTGHTICSNPDCLIAAGLLKPTPAIDLEAEERAHNGGFTIAEELADGDPEEMFEQQSRCVVCEDNEAQCSACKREDERAIATTISEARKSVDYGCGCDEFPVSRR